MPNRRETLITISEVLQAQADTLVDVTPHDAGLMNAVRLLLDAIDLVDRATAPRVCATTDLHLAEMAGAA